ncbi:hypothetical protein O0L34_g16029 [Tuta absoluta]|nr:hypothetical protein O0L34_g16029 [Tuta absoluta]
MWGESSNNCESGCQCSGLITDSFKINSGNNATKRKQEESLSTNFKNKMNPLSLDFKSPLNSPVVSSKRRVLGEITNNSLTQDTPGKRRVFGEIMNMNIDSPRNSPLQRLKIEDRKSPLSDQSPLQRLRTENRISPLIDRNLQSPVTSRSFKRSTTKISRIFEERTKFKMSNKENISLLCNESYVRLDLEEETRDSFETFRSEETVTNWSMTKLDFSDALQSTSKPFEEPKPSSELQKDLFVPEKDMETDLDPEFETLHDLDEEFDADNFDVCTKYEIISTDSPNIISRGGRSTSSRKVNSKDFVFGAPLADNEQSTSFNKPNVTATRMLNFEEERSFEFTSPAAKRSSTSFSVKKSLKFNETEKSPIRFETPTKSNLGATPNKFTPTRNPLRHERSDSSIGSMFSSPSSSNLRLFTSESTTSMESGFISEFEEPFLELEHDSNSPKMPNFNDLLSGQIKENVITNKNFMKRPTLQRSLSFNPEPRAKLNLFSIDKDSPRKSQKRQETTLDNFNNKKRKPDLPTTVESLENLPSSMENLENLEKPRRPTLQRAFSENHASIMSALARSSTEPDLIGDFSLPYCLPLIGGDHSDLKSISCDTLAALIRGEFEDSVEEFKVIDCRYPYEFEGGHIPGAMNLYTPTLVQQLLDTPLQTRGLTDKRSILVFHCEFSLERGPKLYRYLRSSDRSKNMENYPHLNYPEIYLLHKGYRTFHQRYPELCTGNGYTAMLDPKHTQLLKRHRSIEVPSSFFTHHKKGNRNRLGF